MNPIAYCRACLIQVALADGPEDQTRLQAFLETWTPGRELKQRSDHCARCGDYGEVSYYDAIEPTE
jgi:ferredoxin